MGYLHIENLYRCQDILLFKECYALEKVHGTSAHLSYNATVVTPDSVASPALITFFSGGESHPRFVALFNQPDLAVCFALLGHAQVTVYGEAYGGRQQGMSATYGKELRFIVFDVRVGEHWLAVPQAEAVATSLGIEFVPYAKVSTDPASLDAERDRPSRVAERRGMGSDKRAEGVVLRPLIELTKNNGSRIICKHKLEAFSERATPQKIIDPAKLEVLTAAAAIADEWVTPMRLTHVLDKLGNPSDISDTPKVITAMVEDVYREAKGEIVESDAAGAAIRKRAAQLYKQRLQDKLREQV